MADTEQNRFDFSPSFRERIHKSVIALTGLLIGIVTVVGTLLFIENNDMLMFASLLLGALFIFFSLWRILILASVRLYVDEEEIRYRERFVWKRISWSDVISVGRANDSDTTGVLKNIKSLLIMTNEGLRKYDMSTYSLTHGLEAAEAIMEARTKDLVEDEEEIEE